MPYGQLRRCFSESPDSPLRVLPASLLGTQAFPSVAALP